MIYGSVPWVMVDIVIRPTGKSRSPAFSVVFTQQIPIYMDIVDTTIHSSHNYNYAEGNTTELVINADIIDLENSIHVLYYASIVRSTPNDTMLSINSSLCYQSLKVGMQVLYVIVKTVIYYIWQRQSIKYRNIKGYFIVF